MQMKAMRNSKKADESEDSDTSLNYEIIEQSKDDQDDEMKGECDDDASDSVSAASDMTCYRFNRKRAYKVPIE